MRNRIPPRPIVLELSQCALDVSTASTDVRMDRTSTPTPHKDFRTRIYNHACFVPAVVLLQCIVVFVH